MFPSLQRLRFSCLLLLLLALLSSVCQAQSSPQSAVFVEANGPCLLAADAAGNLYASACIDNSIVKVAASGGFSVFDVVPATEEPDGVAAIGSSLYVLVPTGALLGTTAGSLLVLSTVDGSVQAQYALSSLVYAYRIAAAADGQSLWVLDDSALPLWQLGLDGSVLSHVNTSSLFNNEYGNAGTVAVDPSGNVYVAVFTVTPSFYIGSTSVFKFSSSGVFLQNVTINSPVFLVASLAIDSSGDLYLTDEITRTAVKVDWATGDIVQTYNTSAYYEELYGVVIDSTAAYLLVADLYNARIDKFSLQTGQLLDVLPTSQSTIYEPQSLAFLGGDLLVTSDAMGYIAVISPNGTQVDTIYLSHDPDHSPTSLAVDADNPSTSATPRTARSTS
jgi:sugar lactone lactonase YvrE